MLEMTIPSVLDPTLAPPGCHVVLLFTQFTPFHIEGREWTDHDREAYADTGMGQTLAVDCYEHNMCISK